MTEFSTHTSIHDMNKERVLTIAKTINPTMDLTEDQLVELYNAAIDDAVEICTELADLTVPSEIGLEFKAAYVFALDRIRELKFK